MVEAFRNPDGWGETDLRVGSIYDVSDKGFTAVVYNDDSSDPRVLFIPLTNVAREALDRVKPGWTVHCRTSPMDVDGNFVDVSNSGLAC